MMQDGAAAMPPQQEAQDAKVYFFSDNGKMTVELQVEEPLGDGADIEMAQLRAALEKEGVVYGIDEMALQRLAAPTYNKRMVVATGTPAQDGEDGVCKELFGREVEKQFVEREDGTVDFKNLGLITEIKEGATICEITPPTQAIDGTNTLGKPVKGRDGVKAVVPVGENTRLTEDGLRVVAALAGNLVFRDGRFVVETVYRVQDVDYDTGNIQFSGDVLVNGDVLDGFEVHAGGTVTLRGQAGAVVIEAGKDIVIEKGMNGTGKAVLRAEKSIKAGFIENASLFAGEAITASSITNCQVECEGDVTVTSGKGILCGGKITAFGSIKAKEVGNDFNTLTVVVLGVTPNLLRERKRLADQLADVLRHIEELGKNVAYIEDLVAKGKPVPPERVQTLKRVQIQLPMSEKKRDQLQQALDELEGKLADVNTSTLTANVIHPPTKISIGSLTTNVTETQNSCRVYKNSAGELSFGSA